MTPGQNPNCFSQFISVAEFERFRARDFANYRAFTRFFDEKRREKRSSQEEGAQSEK